MGVLLSPNECSKRPELLDILQNTFAFGSVVTLVRDSSLNLISDFEAFGKMNQKTARVQAMTQDATNGKGFSAAWGFHKERRDYLRYQIKQMLNLAHDTSLLKKKTTVWL